MVLKVQVGYRYWYCGVIYLGISDDIIQITVPVSSSILCIPISNRMPKLSSVDNQTYHAFKPLFIYCLTGKHLQLNTLQVSRLQKQQNNTPKSNTENLIPIIYYVITVTAGPYPPGVGGGGAGCAIELIFSNLLLFLFFCVTENSHKYVYIKKYCNPPTQPGF